MRNTANIFLHSRSAFRLRLQVTLAGVLSLFILMANTRFPASSDDAFTIPPPREQETIEMEHIIPTVQPRAPILAPALPLAEVREVSDDVEVTAETPGYDATIESASVLPDVPAGVRVVPPPPPPPVRATTPEPEPEIFVVVEEMPEIEGGLARLYELLEYPEMARLARIEGRVVVEVIVNPDGRPSDPTIMRSANPMLDQSAIKAVMGLTFKPGKQRGKAVKVRYSIPIRFALTEAP